MDKPESDLFATMGRSTVVRFLVVGVANTLVGLGIIFSLKWFFGTPDVVANAIGYTIGFMQSFLLNRDWTFRFQGATLSTWLKFAGVTFGAYAVNLGIVLAALRLFAINDYAGQAMGVLPYAALSYLGCKHFVFVGPARRRRQDV